MKRWAIVASVITVAAGWAWRIRTFVPLGLTPLYDEAVYLTQVTPGLEPQVWSPTRAPGIAWLVSPMTERIGSITNIRGWLLVVMVALFASVLLLWSRHVGYGAIIGGALFAVAWVPTLYGPLVMPNVASGLLVPLILGIWLLDRRFAVLAVAPIALLAGFFRPMDALVAVSACGVISLTIRRYRRDPARYIALAIAVLAVVLPFVAAAASRGGIRAQLTAAQKLIPTGWRWNLDEYVSMLDGPVQFPDPLATVSPSSLTWVITVIAGFLVGILCAGARRILRRRSRDARSPGAAGPALALAVTAVLCALPYLFYVGAGTSISIRYLTPAFLLGSLACGAAVHAAVRGRLVWIGVVIGALLVGITVPSETATARAVAARREVDGREIGVLGTVIAERTAGTECAILSLFVEASFAVMSGCPARRQGVPGNQEWFLAQRAQGRRVVLVTGARELEPSPFEDWNFVKYRGSRGSYYLYEPPEVEPIAPRGTTLAL